MLSGKTDDPVRQQALRLLTATFITQGHPVEYAPHMATAAIFQADLELRNIQLARLLAWLKQEYPEVHQAALGLMEQTREEFEQRINE